MAKRRHNLEKLLWIAGIGAGGYVAWRYVYKPWAAGRRAVDTDAGGLVPLDGPWNRGGGPLAPPATGGTVVAQPINMTPVGHTTLGPQYGGVLGACIQAKGGTWSPDKCAQRLNDLTDAAQNAQTALVQLRTASVNPAAAGIPAATAALAANQAALTNAQAGYQQAVAAGDAAGAAAWQAAMLGHQSDINDLSARIAAAQAPTDNAAAIAAYEAQLAANNQDYFNLTGARLVS